MRQVTLEDFPDSWRAGEGGSRSQESGYDHRRFQLRLDPHTQRTLETFMQTFHRPAAEVIRQLIAQARPEDFPQSWQLAVGPHHPQDARAAHRSTPSTDTGGQSWKSGVKFITSRRSQT
jgi:hypothetical protein